MSQTHRRPKRALLRIFPRLAPKPAATAPAQPLRGAHFEGRPVPSPRDAAAPTRAQLRVRLLRMITENEQQRRHKPHAS
jgi:hypothetical protein